MMSGFEPVKIEWKGREYEVPPERCMGLLAAIEEVIAPGQSVSAIEVLAVPQRAHLTKLAKGYATALRYAGCPVRDEEVYLSLSRGVSKGGADGFEAMKTLADGLLMMFFPDWAREDQEAGNATGGDQTEAPDATPSVAE